MEDEGEELPFCGRGDEKREREREGGRGREGGRERGRSNFGVKILLRDEGNSLLETKMLNVHCSCIVWSWASLVV